MVLASEPHQSKCEKLISSEEDEKEEHVHERNKEEQVHERNTGVEVGESEGSGVESHADCPLISAHWPCGQLVHDAVLPLEYWPEGHDAQIVVPL